MIRNLGVLVLALAPAPLPALAAKQAFVRAESPVAAEAPVPAYRVWGGEWSFRFNHELLAQLGARVRFVDALRSEGPRTAIAIADAGGLEFLAPRGAFERFGSGGLSSRGGFVLELRGESIDLSQFVARARPKHARELEIVDRNGEVWFTIDRLMHGADWKKARWNVSMMDMRIAHALAARLGQPTSVGLAVAEVRLSTNLASDPALAKGDPPPICPAPNWPGSGSGSYIADVRLDSITVQMARCRRSNQAPGCDGGGGDDGEVVFTPDTYLRNTNDSNQSEGGAPCTPGNPCSADVPWYTKFQGTFAPYGNDQHPFLIWNMYRIDGAGRIEQIGRSGLKHAFATANEECAFVCQEANSSDSMHILRKNCGDPYNLGSNDWIDYLAPRSEVIASRGLWGRCGSIHDVNCDGLQDTIPQNDWVHRLVVRESQFEPSSNPGATFLFEAMYVVRDDANVYNTMGRRVVVPTYSGSFWSMFTDPNAFTRGPVIDAWVDPAAPGPTQRNQALATSEGNVKVAVRATQLSAGQYRYDYAVLNVDFSRAVTQGAEPALRVLSNRGFDSVSIAFAADVSVSSPEFGDGDLEGADDWTFSTTGSPAGARWQAPSGATLDWGSMFRFSVIANAPPIAGTMTLGVAQAGSPSSYAVATLVPGSSGVTFQNGFE